MSSEPRHGDLCWMDLNTSDLDAAARFYSSVFGWQIEPWPVANEDERAQVGGYRQIRYRGAVIGGAMRLPEGADMPSWNTFFATDDADQSVAGVEAGGGSLLVGPVPVPVPDGGRVAFFVDTAGAPCGVLEPAGSGVIEKTMEPNTVCWVEVGTRDPETTQDFYRDLFGWRFEALPAGAGAEGYCLIYNGEQNLGGMLEIGDQFPESIGSYWMVYIGVDDLKQTLAAIEREGGAVGFGPVEIPDGTFAVVSDPQGAHFAVIEPSAEAIARAGRNN